MIDIFAIEQRVDLGSETDKMLHVFTDNKFRINYYGEKSILDIFEKNFLEWDYKGIATSLLNYLDYLDLKNLLINDYNTISVNESYNVKNLDEIKLLYILQLLYNITFFDKLLNEFSDYSIDYIISFRKTLELILEKVNYKFVKNDNYYRICKRDYNVDATIAAISNDSLSVDLLSFYDISSSLDRKKSILLNIYSEFESNKCIYNNLNKSLTDKIFMIYNRYNIRHSDKKQIKKDDKCLLELYDDLFQLTLYLLREPNVKEILRKYENT